MGQDLCKIHLGINSSQETNSTTTTAPKSIKDDISYLFPLKTLSLELNNDQEQQISPYQLEYLKQLQNSLFLSKEIGQERKFNAKITQQFLEKIPEYIFEQYANIVNESKNYSLYQQQLKALLIIKINEENSFNLSEDNTQLSYFTIQSLISMILILIKSSEKTNPILIQQILTLTNQLCRQLPMKLLSSSNSLLFKSFEPLINYMENLSLSNEKNLSKQTMEILLSFSIAKGSFKDLLFLLKNLIFNTIDIYNVEELVIQMNNYLTEIITKKNDEEKTELLSVNFLKSMNVYPNNQVNKELFTGQFISSIILAHVDIDNEINSSSQSPTLNSLSYEFHPNTFKDLFDIINQLLSSSSSNDITNHILIICLILFRKHLQLLFDIKTDLADEFPKYVNENELKTWFDLFFELSSNENFSSEITNEALKTLIYITNLQLSLLKGILQLFQQYIIEKKQLTLIEQFLIELNQYNLLSNWIGLFSLEENQNFEILYLLIDLYFIENDNKSQIENLLFTFQCVLLFRLNTQNETTQSFINNQTQLSKLINEYLTYIFNKYLDQTIPINNLFASILLGLCIITDIEDSVSYEFILPIYTTLLPLLTEYYLKNVDNESSEYLLRVIGKISNVLISSLPLDPLEITYMNKLKLPIFKGGYISNNKNEDLFNSNLARYTKSQSVDQLENDHDLLMSIYNNQDEGARLISKLKAFSKSKQYSLGNFPEKQMNDTIAKIFAVYVKHYRRVNLAKLELFQTDPNKVYNQLLSLYEHASCIQPVFSKIKKQGGNCDELSKQIQQRTLFLLLSVKESDLIPLSIDSQAEKKSNDQQQSADKTNAKHIVKLHKNFFEDCIRFKKTTLEKNRSNDSESLLNHSIQTFLYGNFYQSSLSRRNNDDTQFDTDEIEKCLARQYQRAIIRLMTYRFNQIFIENLNNNDKLLSIYLPYLRRNEFDWSYSKNIQLKNDISNTYYSIIKQVLSIPNLTSSIFNLLSFPYESVDLFNLSEEKIVEILFNNSISLTNPSDSLKFLSFNWFRIYVFKLCEYIEKEIILQNQSNDLLQQQELFIFNNLILNELKFFKDKFPIDFKEKEQYKNSFRELTPNLLKDSYQSIHFAFNRYLVLLLRSIHFYKHILPVCSTLDYLQEFLYIYSNNKSNITHLLIIKLLRCIIPCVQNDSEGVAKNLIEEFLSDVLNTISEENCRKEILSELIYLYRRIISVESSWQILAIEFLIKSIENKNNKQLIGSLNILGGFIESIHLGSIVQVDINDDLLFGLIIDIYENEKLYIVQYLGTNESKALPIDALKLEIDVLPPVDLDEYNERIFELLGNFLEINSSKNNLLLLEVKRRSICVLSYLLTNKKSIESFMNKSYISILVEIAKTNIYPADLLVFNKQHLEGYLLSLDRYKTIENESSFQSILMNDDDNSTNWNRTKIHPNPLVVKSLSTSYNGWKPYASEDEVTCYKQGRIGSDEISIVSFPKNISNPQAIQECGNKHKYRGRIISTTDNTYDDFPTFILDNLQLSQGKWYYCVRLPQAGLVQIGWATDGFTTSGMRGVGDDQYSWSYDGSRAVFFYDAGFYGQFDGLRWKADDIIGCGIDIDGQNTNIKYWLNGTFLGPAFTHDVNVPLSTTKCNLLPNGPNRTYYPAITLQRSTVPVELIVSPEDMQGCPLPYGYKPLLSPEVIQTENTIVEYPDHAYLIGENSEEFFMRNSSTTILRDFVNDKHMETSFTGENNDGLMVSLDNNNLSSLTISFDYQILSNDSDKSEFILAKFDSMDILWTKTNQKQRCTIIVLAKKRRIKVYIDNQCETFDDAFQYKNLKQFHLHLLPGVSAQIKNLAIWKYPLSEEQISRLFNYGLFYIANDYQQIKEYRKRVNTISFSKNQQQFQNELLLAFNEPFTETLWEQKKNQVDEDEFKYFKSHSNEDYSTIDLFGHQTYLVLNKPNEQWSNYAIRLEISIPQWPLENENLLLITLNSQTQLYITHDKKLYLDTDYIKEECDLSISLNEYFQVFITVNNQSLLIYINNDLKIDLEMINDRFQLKSNYIDIFKQTQNSTTDDTLLISLKSLSYLNRSMTVDQLQSLSTLISPTFEVIGSSLIAMGYRKHWIDSLINQNLPIILHQQKEELTKIDFDSEQKRYLTILSKLDPSTDADIIKHLIDYSKFNTNEHIIDTAEHVYTYLISSQSTNLLQKKSEFDDNWFSQTVEGLSIPQNLNEWLQTMTSNTNDDDIYQLFDINEAMKKTSKQSIEYSHENLSSEQYYQSRLNCEQGLITIYARTIIVNIFQICSYDQSNLFPLDKFTDYSLLKSLDSIDFNQIKSILKNEFQQNQTLFLFNYLQKDIIIELIEILLKPSLINQIDVNFILNILNIFMELLKDNQNYLDLIFPTILINLIFDLFLLNPVYEIKLSIVSLFTNLLRTNDKFLLPIHIQDFFFQLLIELETNKNLSRNKLRLALIDLIYLLLRDEYELKLSEYIRNLFRLINVLDTWLDTTKHKLLPEKFLEESKRALGEEFIVNQDDFKKSNEYFNIDSDTELTNYMNESILKEISFEDFMRKLPKESQPDRIFYKDYHLLSNIPADCIHSRARLISLLNRFIVTQSPIINSTLTSEQSCLTERFRRIKFYLISPIKYLLFGKSVDKTDASYRNDYLIVKFDTAKASTDTNKPENTMFYQAYQQLHVHAHIEFRRTNVQLWQALYSDMQISDPNELYRDSIRRICSDICSTRLSLFILCSNGRTNRGRNSDYWIPNVFPPNQPIPTKSYNQYRFIGQLLGMAIRTKHYLNIKFPQLLWKRLLNEDLTMEDIQVIDVQSFTTIKQLENNIEQIQSFETDQDMDSVFSRIMSDLHFTVSSSSGQIYELIPDGKNISITTKNFKQYCSLYRQYRLNEFNRQIELIQQGLYSVVPSYYISLFTPNELEELVCGKDRIDIELLKRNTTYGKYYSETSPVIERFWKVMTDMFTDEQRKLFLNYVSGRSTLLTRDEGFQLTFRINRYPVDNNDDVDKIFPRSYRCYFTVDLPAYTTVEIMYERLQYVISSGANIDADEVMSDEPDLEQIIFDDNNVDDI